MSSCPDCGSNFTRRIPRTQLMRFVPGSVHILCTNCGERSLVPPWAKTGVNEKPVVRPLLKSRLEN